MLKAQMTRLADGLDEGYERKRGVKHDFMAFKLSNQKMEFLCTELGRLGVDQSLDICFGHSEVGASHRSSSRDVELAIQ